MMLKGFREDVEYVTDRQEELPSHWLTWTLGSGKLEIQVKGKSTLQSITLKCISQTATTNRISITTGTHCLKQTTDSKTPIGMCPILSRKLTDILDKN